MPGASEREDLLEEEFSKSLYGLRNTFGWRQPRPEWKTEAMTEARRGREGNGGLLSPTGHNWASSCHPLAARPQGTQSHTARPASLITGPQRPEVKPAGQGLMQALPNSPAGLPPPSQQASALFIHSQGEAQRVESHLPKLGRRGPGIQIRVACSAHPVPGPIAPAPWTAPPTAGPLLWEAGVSEAGSSSLPSHVACPCCSPLRPFLLSPHILTSPGEL